jgi:hypothetical protein
MGLALKSILDLARTWEAVGDQVRLGPVDIGVCEFPFDETWFIEVVVSKVGRPSDSPRGMGSRTVNEERREKQRITDFDLHRDHLLLFCLGEVDPPKAGLYPCCPKPSPVAAWDNFQRAQ